MTSSPSPRTSTTLKSTWGRTDSTANIKFLSWHDGPALPFPPGCDRPLLQARCLRPSPSARREARAVSLLPTSLAMARATAVLPRTVHLEMCFPAPTSARSDMESTPATLNNVISTYNHTGASQPTPAGQALITNGLFTLSQLQSLGGVQTAYTASSIRRKPA